jgi:hypothetical protein
MLTLEISGIFLGVLARTLFPWLRKLRQGKLEHFDRRYLGAAVGKLDHLIC